MQRAIVLGFEVVGKFTRERAGFDAGNALPRDGARTAARKPRASPAS
jgi:hypothetical protein